MTRVLLFIPNIIGYIRIVTGLASFCYALDKDTWTVAAGLYSFSYWLDALDGVAARHFGQCSKFGAVLDMVTDRFCTAGLLLVLSHLYRPQYVVFIYLLILDVVSHWCQMYSTLLGGSESHKTSANDKDSHPLLRIYYAFPYALFFICAFNEGFLVGLYVLKFYAGPIVTTVMGVDLSATLVFTLICAPVFVLKQLISVVQLLSAAGKIAKYDEAQIAAKKAK